MKAAVYDRYGSPDEIRVEEIDTPTPGDGEALVRVYAASINSWDWDLLRGKPLVNRLRGPLKPRLRVLGSDIAGRVEAIGRNITRFEPGDAVFGDMSGCGWGAFAEYASAAEDALAKMPAGLTFEQAAAAPQAGLLALQGIQTSGPVLPGQKVLVNGAGGGVGTFAVQMANSLDAEVTGVDAVEKLNVVQSIGADHVIDYRREDFTRGSVRYDRIIDVAAHRSMFHLRRVLTPSGVYILIGGATGRVLQAATVGAWVSVTERKTMRVLVYTKPLPGDLVALRDLLASGSVVPVIDRVFSLSDTGDAFRHFGQGRARQARDQLRWRIGVMGNTCRR